MPHGRPSGHRHELDPLLSPWRAGANTERRQLDELQRNIVGSLMSLLDGTMLDVDYPHARRKTVAAAPAAIFEALKTRDAMLAELATLHHIQM